MNNIESLKVLFLFFGIMFTIVNFGRTLYKQKVPAINFIIQSIGITGFIYMEWLMK